VLRDLNEPVPNADATIVELRSLKNHRSIWIVAAVVSAWAVASTIGFGIVWTSEDNGERPMSVAVQRQILREAGMIPGKVSVITVFHPRCPCSQAAVEELDHLAAEAPTVHLTVIFTFPRDGGPAWLDTSLVRSAKAIPRCHIIMDPDGKLGAALGAKQSGHTLVVDSDGRIAFTGGLTTGRVHSSGSPAATAALDLVDHLALAQLTSPVFGCTVVGCSKSPTNQTGASQ
jgi:hypothetical protein